MYLFINTSLNHTPIRSCLVRQSNNKSISNSEQLFNATELSPVTFGTISPLNLRGKISTNSQISPGTIDMNKNSKVPTIKILLERHRIPKDEKN